MDGLHSIQWRDCALASSVEVPAGDTLILNVEDPALPPDHAEHRRAIVFSGVHAHEVKEMPHPGAPRLLDAAVVASGGGLHTLCIETSTGLRVVSARAVATRPGWHFS